MGERPKGTTLDRLDSARGYEPGNCRWASAVDQLRNKPCVIRLMTPQGEMYLTDYAKVLGISRSAIGKRWRRGQLKNVTRIFP
jgi:hypothetical protein